MRSRKYRTLLHGGTDRGCSAARSGATLVIYSRVGDRSAAARPSLGPESEKGRQSCFQSYITLSVPTDFTGRTPPSPPAPHSAAQRPASPIHAPHAWRRGGAAARGPGGRPPATPSPSTSMGDDSETMPRPAPVEASPGQPRSEPSLLHGQAGCPVGLQGYSRYTNRWVLQAERRREQGRPGPACGGRETAESVRATRAYPRYSAAIKKRICRGKGKEVRLPRRIAQ